MMQVLKCCGVGYSEMLEFTKEVETLIKSSYPMNEIPKPIVEQFKRMQRHSRDFDVAAHQLFELMEFVKYR